MHESCCHIGLHVRWPDPESWVERFFSQVKAWPEKPWPVQSSSNASSQPSAFRLYVGDEFCVHRLPTAHELRSLADYAESRQWGLTLLTPPFTDSTLQMHLPLFEFLNQWTGASEAVLNDWGALNLLCKQMPTLSLGLGRLLNKGFKDPRLRLDDAEGQLSSEALEMLNTCSYAQSRTIALAKRFKVKRMEVDLAPHQAKPYQLSLPASVYFPYGYVSTGRACWLASYIRKGPRRFAPPVDCAQHCFAVWFSLNGQNSPVPLFHFGNTAFYRYPAQTVASLLQGARQGKFRLVFQGLAMGTS